jgi:hypothetical protein
MEAVAGSPRKETTMGRDTAGSSGGLLEDCVEAFEAARVQGEGADFRDYLPEARHPLYRGTLRELVRVDLEYSWRRGRPRRVEDYRSLVPELFDDDTGLRDIAFEEYRLRCMSGESPSPLEYAQRFGWALGDVPWL